jgi:tetratricopeptide (TPR) repeat protein
VDHLVQEAQGNPFVALQLARLAAAELAQGKTNVRAVSLEDLTERTKAMLSSGARRLLWVLSVAGRPVLPRDALRAAGIQHGGRGIIHELRGLNLVRTRNVGGERMLAFYHDRIRHGVLHGMDAKQLQSIHGALLATLEQGDAQDPDWLHSLALGAAQPELAFRYGLAAAARAMAALAFERAAELYSACLELTAEAAADCGTLWRNLAEALVCCGRGGSAADAYLEAGKYAPPEEAVSLMRLAASHLLRSGRFDEGERLVAQVLQHRSLSLPETEAGLMAAIAWERCRVRVGGLTRKLRADGTAPRHLLEQFDLFYSLRADLWAVDSLRVALLQARSLRWAVEAGEPSRIILALCGEANLVSTEGSEQAMSHASRLLEQAGELVGKFDSPIARAAIHMSRGWAAWMLGRSADVIEPCYEVERTFRLLPQDERGYFMRSLAATLRTSACRDLGQYRRFTEEMDAIVREARATENHRALLTLTLNETIADALRGRPEASVSRLESQREMLPHRRFGLLRALHMISVARAACATGQYEWGLRRLDEDWPMYLRSPVSRTAFIAVLARASRVNLTLNAALAAGDVTNVEAAVAADLKALGELPVAGAQVSQRQGQARLAGLRGDYTRAADELRRTVEGYQDLGWLGEAACTRHALGVLVGGDEGAALCKASDNFMRQEQIADPIALVRSAYPEVFARR